MIPFYMPQFYCFCSVYTTLDAFRTVDSGLIKKSRAPA